VFFGISRNRLAGNEPPPDDASFFFWVVLGSREGTALGHEPCRQAARDCTPSFWVS